MSKNCWNASAVKEIFIDINMTFDLMWNCETFSSELAFSANFLSIRRVSHVIVFSFNEFKHSLQSFILQCSSYILSIEYSNSIHKRFYLFKFCFLKYTKKGKSLTMIFHIWKLTRKYLFLHQAKKLKCNKVIWVHNLENYHLFFIYDSMPLCRFYMNNALKWAVFHENTAFKVILRNKLSILFYFFYGLNLYIWAKIAFLFITVNSRNTHKYAHCYQPKWSYPYIYPVT